MIGNFGSFLPPKSVRRACSAAGVPEPPKRFRSTRERMNCSTLWIGRETTAIEGGIGDAISRQARQNGDIVNLRKAT
jgi:hypothetical protein